MQNDREFESQPTSKWSEYTRLARWLQQVMQQPPYATASLPETSVSDVQLELLLGSQYHIQFYQQLPDFVMALLNNDAQATVHYAPLLYHLAGCQECHAAYLDIYDAMRAAVQPRGPRPLLGQGTRTLNAMPQRVLGHLCQVAISQAEAVIQQGRRTKNDTEAEARSLLQMALRIGAQIVQISIRRQALHDLVRVATLAQGQVGSQDDDPNKRSYTPTLVAIGGMRGKKVVRRADALHRSQETDESLAIPLQSHALEGRIVQSGDVLELHLKDLDQALRGQHVRVSVLLGSLLEPVRGYGGNPHMLISPAPVAADGSLRMPLGETDLRLSNTEEYHLLETMFMLLEVLPMHTSS